MLLFSLPAGLTVLCLATLIHAADNVCYHPNGSPSDDVPCDPNSQFSMCCSSSTACLASGLCKSIKSDGKVADTNKFIRATCTDMTWTSDVCPPFCMPTSGSSNISAFNLNLSQNDVHIRQCHSNQTFSLTARFCCGYADEKAQCCGTPEALFELSAVSSSADTPVALNPADGSPKPWNPISLSSPSSSESSTSLPTQISTSSSISLCATPKTPLAATPSSTSSDTSSSARATTADPGKSDSSVPSTDPPSSVSSPTAAASSTPASRRPTTPTTAAAASAVVTALADSTGAGSSLSNSGKSANSGSNSPSDPNSWPSKGSHSRLSTGAIAGIGFGASIAAAGLVTISVYFFARRRLYMKQKRKWEEQMKASGVGGGGAGAGGPAMVAVQTQTADGKPAVVMLAGGQTISPMSLRDLKDMRWDTQSVSESSELDSKRLSATTTRSNGRMEQEDAVKKSVDQRGERTATWFARHSIYEMG